MIPINAEAGRWFLATTCGEFVGLDEGRDMVDIDEVSAGSRETIEL